MISWNPNIVEHLSALRDEYNVMAKKEMLNSYVLANGLR